MPPILYRTVRLSITMGRDAFTRSARLTQHHAPIPGTGGYLIYKELMQWKEYLPVCTDTITLFQLYCQQLFSSFIYLPFKGLAGGMPTLSRGPVPLDSYRVSHITGFVKHFFDFFHLFLLSLGAAGGCTTYYFNKLLF